MYDNRCGSSVMARLHIIIVVFENSSFEDQNRQIIRDGPVPWPPDLNPLDSYFWGYAKDVAKLLQQLEMI